MGTAYLLFWSVAFVCHSPISHHLNIFNVWNLSFIKQHETRVKLWRWSDKLLSASKLCFAINESIIIMLCCVPALCARRLVQSPAVWFYMQFCSYFFCSWSIACEVVRGTCHNVVGNRFVAYRMLWIGRVTRARYPQQKTHTQRAVDDGNDFFLCKSISFHKGVKLTQRKKIGYDYHSLRPLVVRYFVTLQSIAHTYIEPFENVRRCTHEKITEN